MAYALGRDRASGGGQPHGRAGGAHGAVLEEHGHQSHHGLGAQPRKMARSHLTGVRCGNQYKLIKVSVSMGARFNQSFGTCE